MSIYTELKEIGAVINSHCSDLYTPDTPEAREILERNGKKLDGWNVQRFQSEGQWWLEVPFAYEPYWDNKSKGA